MYVGRNLAGIPDDWSTVENWINEKGKIEFVKKTVKTTYEKKFKNIPTLERYDVPANEEFWSNFPSRGIPKKPSTRVNVNNLRKLVCEAEQKLLVSEKKRADKVLKDLKEGADAYQKDTLPAMSTYNSKTSYKNGEMLTDKVATWIEGEIVSGPFKNPPMPGFRANPLIAIERNNKVRLVINMSGPKGASFNENLMTHKLEKIHMTTAKEFGYSLKEAGKNAIFSKFDLKDAYKLVPARPMDYRLQGFEWLGRYYFETQQTFGGVPSVSNFDRLGNTVEKIVTVLSNTPRKMVSRTLDDFQVVSPENSGITEEFSRKMKEVCSYANIPLAEECPKCEKAFVMKKKGTILGVQFDSTKMEWSLSEEKADKIVGRCMDACGSSHISLKQAQELV